jgi:hypothetical protein
MTQRQAAVLSLGRTQGMGETRRVESWVATLESAGFEPTVIRLIGDHGVTPTRPPVLSEVLAGRAAVETLRWSAASVNTALRQLDPALTICVTLRAFSPRLRPPRGPVVLDFVDRLSRSYRDRAGLSGGWAGRAAWTVLGRRMGRLEAHPPGGPRTAAGFEDAASLGARWFPNVVTELPPPADSEPTHDLVFFGNLAYPPNVAAIERLAELWPRLTSTRPGTTALITGRNPDEAVRRAVTRMGGGALEDGYQDAWSAARRGRVAVAPLDHVAGMQNKVLEAAAAGVVQVVSHHAAGGFPPHMPLLVADDDEAFVTQVIDVLTHPDRYREHARQAQAYVASTFVPDAWRGFIDDLLR